MKILLSVFAALVIWANPAAGQSAFPVRDSATFWHDQYDVGTGIFVGEFPDFKELRWNYHRQWAVVSWNSYTDSLLAALGWLPDDKMVVVGAGFGFLEEHLRDHDGFTNLLSIDDSVWIQAAKATTEDADMDAQIAAVGINPLAQEGRDLKAQLTDGGTRARLPILNENLMTKESRTTVKQQFSGQVDVVFSDFMILWLTDAEAISLSEQLNQTGAMVQHATCNGIDGRTLTDWVALIPGDTFVDTCAGYAVAP